MWVLAGVELLVGLILWQGAASPVVPKPFDLVGAMEDLGEGGIIPKLINSLFLYGEAILFASLISLGFAYAATMNVMKPVAAVWGKFRFLGMVGLPFLFTILVGGGHRLALSLLVCSVSWFMIVGMQDVIEVIPKEEYDLARTLRMGEWEIVWELIVVGQVAPMMDVVRQNAAMGWMMLPMVEALVRSEDGIGGMLANQGKGFHLDQVFAIQVLILVIGIGQDWGVGWIKKVVCPYV